VEVSARTMTYVPETGRSSSLPVETPDVGIIVVVRVSLVMKSDIFHYVCNEQTARIEIITPQKPPVSSK